MVALPKGDVMENFHEQKDSRTLSCRADEASHRPSAEELTKTSFSFPLLLVAEFYCKAPFFLSTLKDHGEEERCSMSGEKPMLLPSSNKARRRT